MSQPGARAFTTEQKNQRREQILEAAASLFECHRFDEIAMIDIATSAGVAKGTLYLYFRTKEELFLAYAEREIGNFFAALHTALHAHETPGGIGVVMGGLGDAMIERPAMRRLLALLHLVLESNTEFERALEFRRGLVPVLEQTGAELERHLWFLPAGAGARVLLTLHGMTLGFQQLADPSPVIRQVEQQPGMELFSFSFERALLDSGELLLAGMEARAREANTTRTVSPK